MGVLFASLKDSGGDHEVVVLHRVVQGYLGLSGAIGSDIGLYREPSSNRSLSRRGRVGGCKPSNPPPSNLIPTPPWSMREILHHAISPVLKSLQTLSWDPKWCKVSSINGIMNIPISPAMVPLYSWRHAPFWRVGRFSLNPKTLAGDGTVYVDPQSYSFRLETPGPAVGACFRV